MRIKLGDLWFCHDCTLAACNGDFPEGESETQAILKGLDVWGPGLVPDWNSETGEGILEFSRIGCDCCDSDLAGGRHRFAVLGE